MEISRNSRADLAKVLLGVQETERPSGQKAVQNTSGQQDRVQISEHAKELQRLKSLTGQPDVARDVRVEKIRQSVEAGAYTVDGTKVANAIIRQVLTDSIL